MQEHRFRNLVSHVVGDRYRLVQVLSWKENRAVFRANDLRLGRAVAVKVGLGGTGSMTREWRTSARLPHHPKVTPVYDYGTDGVLRLDYMVLELLDGITLASALEHARWPMRIDKTTQILRGISAGLNVLHRLGIVHCDLNPSHVFLQGYQSEDDIVNTRLLSFGNSQALKDEVELTSLPRERDYLAPEQLSGKSVTPATDIYSCGLIGLKLVGGSPHKVNSADESVVESEFERVLRFRPEMPEWLVRLLRRCLRNDPDRRYDRASQLWECLEQRNAELYPERVLASTARVHPATAEAAAMPPSWAEILQLKPNVWGIGLDVEALWRWWRWRQERKRS